MSLWHKLATLMIYVTEFCIAKTQMASQAFPSVAGHGRVCSPRKGHHLVLAEFCRL